MLTCRRIDVPVADGRQRHVAEIEEVDRRAVLKGEGPGIKIVKDSVHHPPQDPEKQITTDATLNAVVGHFFFIKKGPKKTSN